MEHVLYADILFFINFSMDFITLYLTSRLTSGPPTGIKAAISAAIGGIYVTVAVIFGIDGILGITASGIISAVMVALSMGYGGMRLLFRRAAVFWGFAALLGGVMTAICSFGGSFGAPGSPAGGTALLFIGSSLCLLFLRIISRFRARKTVTVIVEHGGKTAEFSALCDSGNLVRDPLSSRPVILADRSVVGFALADNIAARLRMIPVNGIGGGGLLTGFVPDTLKIVVDGKERICDAIIAVTDLGDTFFGGYPANFPTSIL